MGQSLLSFAVAGSPNAACNLMLHGSGFPKVTGRVNFMTGEVIPVPPWVGEIDMEDISWFERHWASQDEWDYRFEWEMKHGHTQRAG